MASSQLTRENVLAFLGRDWDLARHLKDQATGLRVRARGATAAFKLSQMLLDQVWDQVKHQPSDVRGLLRYRRKMSRAAAARRNDLLVLKTLAGRPKDLEDVRALLRSGSPELDVAVVRRRLAELGRLIDDASLVGLFDAQVASARRQSR